MNKKRWLALALVVVLFFVSIGFRFATSVASGFLTDVSSFVDDNEFHETVIEDGSMTSKIAVLSLDGVIQDIDTSGILATTGYNHQLFLKQIDQAAEDPFVEAVILTVNTPGGGVVESAQIHERLIKLQEDFDKPLYVSMGGTAASGGYYVSAPADKIFAENASLTGSIGVIMQNINFTKFAEKHGVEFNTITSGKHKDIMSSSREMTEEEHTILQTMIDELYEDFVDVIVNGRDMDEETVRKLGDGRIYTGKQAAENGLVDEIGSVNDAIQSLKEDYNLEKSQVVHYESKLSVIKRLGMSVQSLFNDKQSEIAQIKSLMDQTEGPRAMYLYTN